MRLLWLPSVLRAAGLDVETTPGWELRGKDGPLAPMSPQVVVCHHTAVRAATPDSAVANLLIKGRPDLPGPLAHLGLTRSGRYVVIASGVANHAGLGGWAGFTGNRRAIGIEAYNSGLGEPWPTAQLDAYDRGSAAILKHLSLPAARLCGHKEWAPNRKIDPQGIDMLQMRNRVAALMIVEEFVNQLTADEIAFLKAFIAGVLAVNSNADFAKTLIEDFRARNP